MLSIIQNVKTCQLGEFLVQDVNLTFITCIPCPPGTFNLIINATSCTPCISGQYAPNASSVSCLQCPAGTETKIRDSLGNSVGDTTQSCNQCMAGMFNSFIGSECIPCPPGFHTNGTLGSTLCTKCPTGSFSNASGTSQCSPCPIGTYAPFSLIDPTTFCIDCENGSVTNIELFNQGIGASSCQFCPIGTEAFIRSGETIVSKSLYCLPCIPGYSRNTIISDSCLPCPVGTKSADIYMSILCLLCEPGYFSNTTGSIECQQCPPNSYTNVFGQSECIPCTDGFYTNGTEECQPVPKPPTSPSPSNQLQDYVIVLIVLLSIAFIIIFIFIVTGSLNNPFQSRFPTRRR